MCPIRARQSLFTNAAPSEPPPARFRNFSTMKMQCPARANKTILTKTTPPDPSPAKAQTCCGDIRLIPNVVSIRNMIVQTYTSQCSPTIGQSCFGRMCVQHCSCAEAILLLIQTYTSQCSPTIGQSCFGRMYVEHLRAHAWRTFATAQQRFQ